MFRCKLSAFTLAEVLITLGIIGVVAAMTIPSLMQNSKDKAAIVALKKTYSTYSQAFTMAVKDNGSPEGWNVGDYSGSPQPTSNAQNIITILAPYLKMNKTCTGAVSNGCAVSSYYLNGTSYDFTSGRMFRAELADGSYLATYSLASGCNWGGVTSLDVCAYMIMDINGAKLPNIQGRDIFWFYLTRHGIVPLGTNQELATPFSTNCADKSTATGSGCAGWVIYNENMDYLRCTGLAWGGQTTCN